MPGYIGYVAGSQGSEKLEELEDLVLFILEAVADRYKAADRIWGAK